MFNPFLLTKKPPNHLSFGGLDRKSHLREDYLHLQKIIKNKNTKVLPIFKNKNLFKKPKNSNDIIEPAFIPIEIIRKYIYQKSKLIYLGEKLENKRYYSYIACDFSDFEEEFIKVNVLPFGIFHDLREVNSLIDGFNGSLLAYARAMVYWQSQNQFCNICGSRNKIVKNGHQMNCSNLKCNNSSFPRSDPAVIMLVYKNDKVLLGRQKIWRKGMYSTLAGFVEPGETLEHAVAREVYEESGVIVNNIVYHSSQPWPFHSSLMLGFFAEATTEKIKINEEEIEDVQWFSRNELLNFRSYSKHLPRKLSISRRLIEDWIKSQ